MNWRDYEKEIYEYFTQSFPGTSIKYDQKIDGRYSKVERQIDVLIASISQKISMLKMLNHFRQWLKMLKLIMEF